MQEKIIEIPAGSDYTEADHQHKRATVEAIRRNDGRYVSPMTWKDGQYLYSLHLPEPEGEPMPVTWEAGEADDDEPDEDPECQAQRQAIQRINTSDVMRDFSLHVEDEPLSSPLVQAIEVWLSEPQPDWSRLMASPMNCERVGRHVLGLLAGVIERHVLAAMAPAAPGRS
jgi:hypothetical protein